MKARMKELETRLTARVDAFAELWGPISWRDRLATTSVINQNSSLAKTFWALANIEDESAYMRRKVAWTRADRLRPIDDFNAMWLGEELEHARALSAISTKLGYDAPRRAHSLLHRDKRSGIGAVGIRVGAVNRTGMLGGYLALGALQEHTALTTYNALARLDIPDGVASILRDIARQEGRHMRFYRTSALDVFEMYPMSRPFAREMIKRSWRPVGIDLLGLVEWKSVFFPVLEGSEYRAKLEQVDSIAADLLGSPIPLMERFLERNPPRCEEQTPKRPIEWANYSGMELK